MRGLVRYLTKMRSCFCIMWLFFTIGFPFNYKRIFAIISYESVDMKRILIYERRLRDECPFRCRYQSFSNLYRYSLRCLERFVYRNVFVKSGILSQHGKMWLNNFNVAHILLRCVYSISKVKTVVNFQWCSKSVCIFIGYH